MKESIAWFTPFSTDSAIGSISALICEKLKEKYDITIFAPITKKLIKTDISINTFDSYLKISKLDKYNHIIYNMGNNASFHIEMFNIFVQVKGVVILHDRVMIDFFRSLFFTEEFSKINPIRNKNFFEFVRSYNYGITDNELEDSFKDKKVPLLQPIIENAYGIFTHARNFFSELKNYANLPSAYSYLPCEIQEPDDDKKNIIFNLFQREKNKLLIISTGMVQSTKKIHEVANVLMKNSYLRNNIQYIVVGGFSGDYGLRLEQLAAGELKGCLYMLGYQPTDVMESALYNADIAINMRYPNTEACSLSLLEQMAFAKPVVVINSGIYAEMPDDAVIKIDIEREEDELEQVLLKAVDDRQFYQSYGVRAKKFVEENCKVQNYIDHLSDFLNRYKNDYALAGLQNNLLDTVSLTLKNLGFSYDKLPENIDNIISILYEVTDETK